MTNYSVSGKMPARTANGFAGLAPYGAFRARDGDIIVGAGNDSLFGKLAKLLAHPEWIGDSRFSSNVARVANKSALNALISHALASDDSASWLARLSEAGIPSLRLTRLPLSFDGRRPDIGPAPSPGQNDAEFP